MAHLFPDGSWGVRVQGGSYRKRKENPPVIDQVAGDGRYGYRTRPKKDAMVEVQAWDGQPFIRVARKSAVRKQKSGCRLASRVECAGRNVAEVQERLNQTKARVELERDCRPRFRARKGQRPVAAR